MNERLDISELLRVQGALTKIGPESPCLGSVRLCRVSYCGMSRPTAIHFPLVRNNTRGEHQLTILTSLPPW